MRHKTLGGVVLILLGVVLFACHGIASFNPVDKARYLSLVPVVGAIALGAGFRLTIVDERRPTA